MSVSSSTAKTGPLACNGSLTAFPSGAFRILAADEITVTLTNALVEESELTLATDYSISPTGGTYPADSFTVNTVATYDTGYLITISRNNSFTQGTSYGKQGPFDPQIHETDFDRTVLRDQELKEELDRCVKQSISDDDALDAAEYLAACEAAAARAEAAASGYPTAEVYLSSYGSLSTAVSTIGATEMTLVIDQDDTLAGVVTVPSTLSLRFIQGSVVTTGSNVLTINGSIISGLYQIFSSSSTYLVLGDRTIGAYPEWWGAAGDGSTDDSTEIQAAIDALTAGSVVLSDNYAVDTGLVGDSNVNLTGTVGTSKITIGTAYIDAFTATSKNDISISGIEFIGSALIVSTERQLFFDTCTDINVSDCTFSESIIALQTQTCTNAKIHSNHFFDIRRKSDGEQGYGILANLDCDSINCHGNSFNNVERHCVYFTAGTSNSIMEGNIAIDPKGAPYDCSATDGQNTVENVIISNNIARNLTVAPSGSDDRPFLILNGNLDGIIVSNNNFKDNTQGGGILVQHASTYATGSQARNIRITGNIIDNCDAAEGISILNCRQLSITGNTIRDIDTTYNAISVAVSGTGTGSLVDDVYLSDNFIDTSKNGINVAGVDGTHKATGIVFGENKFKDMLVASYAMGDVAYIEYDVTARLKELEFYVDSVTASQTDVVMTTYGASNYNAFVAPFNGIVKSVYIKSSGSISAGSITVEIRKDNVNSSTGATLSSGSVYTKGDLSLDAYTFSAGDKLQLIYTTDSGFLPSGSRDIVAGIEILRDLSV